MAFNAELYVRSLNEYLQKALREYNKDITPNWYGWKKYNDEGNRIPDVDRMQHQYIKIIVEGATIPSKSDLDAKMVELRNTDLTQINSKHEDAKAGKVKLKALGLSDNEIAAIYPCGYCPECLGSD